MYSPKVPQSDENHERVQWIADLYRREFGHDAVSLFPQTIPFAIEGKLPLAVIYPKLAEHIAAILEIAKTHDITVTPWGGGTQIALGYRPNPIDIVVSLENISGIIGSNFSDKTVTMGGGTTIKQANYQLAAHRYFVPIDGPYPYKATIGGRISAGINGLRRSMYGNLHEMMLSLQFAGVTGKLSYTTGAYSASFEKYDLNKLFVGTLGTLGIITEVTVPIQPIPQIERLVVASFEYPEQAWDWLEDLDSFAFDSCSIVLCSPGTLAVGSGLSESHFRQLTPDKNMLVIGRFAGSVAHVQRKILAFHAVTQKYDLRKIIMLGGIEIPALWRILDDFSTTYHLQSSEAVMQVAMIPTDIVTLIAHCNRFAGEYDIAITWQADVLARSMTIRLHNINHLPDDTFAAVLQTVYASLSRRWLHSTMLGCMPSMKTNVAIWGVEPPGFEIARSVKRIIDPTNILNPGRIIRINHPSTSEDR